MQWWAQLIAICAISAIAGYAGGSYRPVSASSRLRRALTELEVELSSLALALDAVKKQQKLLSARQATSDYRAGKRAMAFDGEGSVGEVPPVGTSKPKLREFYAKQLELNRAGRHTQAAEAK